MQRACPQGLCDGSGFIIDEEANTASPCPCRAQLVARRRSGALTAAIPKRYRGISFDRQPLVSMPADTLGPVRSYCSNIPAQHDAGRGLWLWGPVGTGKTTLSMAVAQAAIDAHFSVAIYQLPRLLAQIRETYDDHSPITAIGLHDQLAQVDFLFLDDLGAHKSSEWVHEQLYSIIDSRYAWCRPVIVTSDIADFGELAVQMGERTVSRLRGICGPPISFEGPDMRVSPPLRAVDDNDQTQS